VIALHEAEPSTPLPYAIHAGRPHFGSPGLPGPNVFPALDDLDPVFRVDHHRHPSLRHVRDAP